MWALLQTSPLVLQLSSAKLSRYKPTELIILISMVALLLVNQAVAASSLTSSK